MTAFVRLDHVRHVLDQCGLRHAQLALADGYRLVIVERGGHALGPFDADGRSVLWLNPAAWESAEAMTRFVAAGQWNIGGERFWLAPEIRFTIRDRADYWGSYALPPEMAPGSYRLQDAPASVTLAAEAALRYYNPPGDHVGVRIERRYRSLPNPLRHLGGFAELGDGVAYAGFSHAVALTLLPGSSDGAMLEAWTLAQLVPNGTIVVPATEGLEYEDYYEKVDAGHLRLVPGGALLAVTGRRRYKVGLRAPHLGGRAGFLKPLPGGQAELIVRNFFNDPSAEYVEEPADRPGCRGLSVHVYNDGGAFGGFGELECNGRTIGGGAGTAGHDDFGFWFFAGAIGCVRRIADILLGPVAAAAPLA